MDLEVMVAGEGGVVLLDSSRLLSALQRPFLPSFLPYRTFQSTFRRQTVDEYGLLLSPRSSQAVNELRLKDLELSSQYDHSRLHCGNRSSIPYSSSSRR